MINNLGEKKLCIEEKLLLLVREDSLKNGNQVNNYMLILYHLV